MSLLGRHPESGGGDDMLLFILNFGDALRFDYQKQYAVPVFVFESSSSPQAVGPFFMMFVK